MPSENEQPQGTGTPSPQGAGDSPKYVTEEQLNKAISARFGGFEKKLEKTLGDFTTAFSTSFEERLSTFAPKAPEKAPSASDARLEESPIVKGLQKQLEEQRKQTEAIKQERDAEKARARDTQLRQRLADEVTKAGVDPTRVRQVVGLLVDSEKSVRFAEDGESITFGDVDLTTGVRAWVKSDDAKIFLPPRGISGSGDRPGKGPNTNGHQPQRGELGMGLAQMLANDGLTFSVGPKG